MNDIEYLIKICSCESHVNDLMEGQLYMNAAGFYRYLEKGQGDCREASISSTHQLFKDSGRPIYCMYAACQDSIEDGILTIPNKVIQDFAGNDGWLVIVGYKAFENRLGSLDTEGRLLTGGLVQYCTLTQEDMHVLISSNNDWHLLIKHPDFKYQNEFRLIVGATLQRNTYEGTHNGLNATWIDDKQPYQSKTYFLPRGIEDIAQKYRIADYLDDLGNFRIPIEAPPR